MKKKSAILVVATAVVGFAFITPDAKALPGWKAGIGGGYYFHKAQVEKAKARATMAPTETTLRAKMRKTIGLSVEKPAKKIRPYFQRKHGAPAFRSER